MGVVNPSQSNPDDEITADAINAPINQLAAVLNGNVDSNNLADSAVSTTKLAAGAVTSSKLAPSKTTDANGWTVYDHGTWKEYVKLFTGGSVSSLAGGAQGTVFSSQNLPSGTTRGALYLLTQGGNDSSSGTRYYWNADGNRTGTDTSTTFAITVRNITGASLTESSLTCMVRAIDR